MNKKTLDKIINFIREEMTTQSTTGKPGFSSDADDKGPVAGRGPKMFFVARKYVKKYANGGPGSRKIWLDNLKTK
jgi:hypothetical protein